MWDPPPSYCRCWSGAGLAARLEVTERTGGAHGGAVPPAGRLGRCVDGWAPGRCHFTGLCFFMAANTPACLRVAPGPALAVAVEDKSGAALVWVLSFPS